MKKLLLLLMLLPATAMAVMVDVTFTPPTEREDNTPLDPAEIAAYIVYDRGTVINGVVFSGNSFELDLPFGRHDITMVTVDTDGLQSVQSLPVSIILNASPKPATGLGVSRRN